MQQLSSRPRLIFATTLTITVAGCGPQAPLELLPAESGTAQRGLVNGTSHNGHAAVGAITSGGSLCTATLVGLKTVITAAHCVEPGRKHWFVASGRYWRAASVKRHEQYNPNLANHDVAVVILEEAPPVTPASITTQPPVVGQELILIGYGATSSQGNGSGVKRVGTNTVAYVTQSRIIISGSSGALANLCFGDSGGPSFATIGDHEVQVGIHSTISGACGQQGHDMRVDLYADWFRQVAGGDLSEDGLPSPAADQEPPTVTFLSPAAGEEVYPRATVIAEASDNHKVARVVLTANGLPVGELDAEPWRFDVELPVGAQTLELEAYDLGGNVGKATLQITTRPLGLFGEACAAHDQCSSSLCARKGDSPGYCTQLCQPGVAEAGCPKQAACLPAGAQHACGPPLLPEPPATNEAPATDPGEPGGGCRIGDGGAAGAASAVLVVSLWFLLSLSRRRRHD